MIACKTTRKFRIKITAIAVVCVFFVNTLSLAADSPDTLAVTAGDAELYNEISEFMQRRYDLHNDASIDPLIKSHIDSIYSLTGRIDPIHEFAAERETIRRALEEALVNSGAEGLLHRLENETSVFNKATGKIEIGAQIQLLILKNNEKFSVFEGKEVRGHASNKYLTIFVRENELSDINAIVGKIFHEIRARSHRPDQELKEFEKVNRRIELEVKKNGRILDPALRNEFVRLAFPVDLDIMHRDYTTTDERSFDGSLKGKKKTGVSKWDLLERFRDGLTTLSEPAIARLREERSLGARRSILVASGLGVAAAIDGKFLASELDRFLQLRQPAPAVPAAPSRPFLYTLKPGRHLIAHMADDFDFIVKMPKSGKTLDFVSRNWLGRGYKLAGERLGGPAVPTMVIDAMDGSKKPFSYLVEKSGARKTDLAIIQKKVVPVFERLKYLAKEKRVSEAEDLIDKYKEFVVAMFRRGVMDFDFTYPYGNCGVDPETGNIYLFDFGELDGNSGNVEMFLEQLGVTNKYFYDDLKQYTNDEIAAYYGISPLQMKDFFTESGESLFGVDLKPGEEGRIRMSFSYSEEQIRRIFMSHTLNETPDDDVISGRGDLAKTAPAKKPARRPGDPYYFAHPDSAPEPDPDREIIPSPNNQPLRAPRPEPPRQSGEEAQEKVRVAREEAAGQDTEAAQNESAVEAQNPNAIPIEAADIECGERLTQEMVDSFAPAAQYSAELDNITGSGFYHVIYAALLGIRNSFNAGARMSTLDRASKMLSDTRTFLGIINNFLKVTQNENELLAWLHDCLGKGVTTEYFHGLAVEFVSGSHLQNQQLQHLFQGFHATFEKNGKELLPIIDRLIQRNKSQATSPASQPQAVRTGAVTEKEQEDFLYGEGHDKVPVDLEYLKKLLPLLQSPYLRMRMGGALMLANIAYYAHEHNDNRPELQGLFNQALPLLISNLDHEDATVRGNNANALGQLGPIAGPAIPKLKALLRDPEPIVHNSAYDALHYLGFGIDELDRIAPFAPAAESEIRVGAAYRADKVIESSNGTVSENASSKRQSLLKGKAPSRRKPKNSPGGIDGFSKRFATGYGSDENTSRGDVVQKNMASKWKTELWNLETCKNMLAKIYDDNYRGHGANTWRLAASAAALSEDEQKELLAWEKSLLAASHRIGFAANLIKEGKRNLYRPIYDLCDYLYEEFYERLRYRPLDIMYMPEHDEEKFETMLNISARHRVLANGTGNTRNASTRYENMDVRLSEERSLLNIILEKEVKSFSGIGMLIPNYLWADPFTSTVYGPYYVIFKRSVPINDGHSGMHTVIVPEEDHAIYLVPRPIDAELIRGGIAKAVELRIISEDYAKKAISKLMTWDEFIADEEYIDEIVDGRLIPAAAAESELSSVSPESAEFANNPNTVASDTTWQTIVNTAKKDGIVFVTALPKSGKTHYVYQHLKNRGGRFLYANLSTTNNSEDRLIADLCSFFHLPRERISNLDDFTNALKENLGDGVIVLDEVGEKLLSSQGSFFDFIKKLAFEYKIPIILLNPAKFPYLPRQVKNLEENAGKQIRHVSLSLPTPDEYQSVFQSIIREELRHHSAPYDTNIQDKLMFQMQKMANYFYDLTGGHAGMTKNVLSLDFLGPDGFFYEGISRKTTTIDELVRQLDVIQSSVQLIEWLEKQHRSRNIYGANFVTMVLGEPFDLTRKDDPLILVLNRFIERKAIAVADLQSWQPNERDSAQLLIDYGILRVQESQVRFVSNYLPVAGPSQDVDSRIDYRGPRGDSGGYLNKLIYEAAQAFNEGRYEEARDKAGEAVDWFDKLDAAQDDDDPYWARQVTLEDLDNRGAGASDCSETERRKAEEILAKAEAAIPQPHHYLIDSINKDNPDRSIICDACIYIEPVLTPYAEELQRYMKTLTRENLDPLKIKQLEEGWEKCRDRLRQIKDAAARTIISDAFCQSMIALDLENLLEIYNEDRQVNEAVRGRLVNHSGVWLANLEYLKQYAQIAKLETAPQQPKPGKSAGTRQREGARPPREDVPASNDVYPLSLSEAMARMPYIPEWLDQPALTGGRTPRQMIVEDEELNVFIETLAPQLDRMEKESLVLNHGVFTNSYEDADRILQGGFLPERLSDVGWGKSLWAREGPYGGPKVSRMPYFNMEFRGYALEETGPNSAGAKILAYVDARYMRRFPGLRTLDFSNSALSGYIYDLILKAWGIDAVWYRQEERRIFEIKEFRVGRAVKNLQLMTGQEEKTMSGVAPANSSKDLLLRLKDPDREIRAAAVEEFRSRSPNEKQDISSRLLATIDQNGPAYLYTLESVSAIASLVPDKKLIVNTFVKALRTDERHDVKRTAVLALARLGYEAKDAIPALAEALQSSTDSYLTGEIVKSLAEIGPLSKAAIPVLLSRLNSLNTQYGGMSDTDQCIYCDAVKVLGKIGSEGLVPYLSEVMFSKGADVNLRDAAMEALWEIYSEESLEEGLASESKDGCVVIKVNKLTPLHLKAALLEGSGKILTVNGERLDFRKYFDIKDNPHVKANIRYISLVFAKLILHQLKKVNMWPGETFTLEYENRKEDTRSDINITVCDVSSGRLSLEFGGERHTIRVSDRHLPSDTWMVELENNKMAIEFNPNSFGSEEKIESIPAASPARQQQAEEAEIRTRARKALRHDPTQEQFAVIWQAHLAEAKGETGNIGYPDPKDGIYRHGTLSPGTKQMKYNILAESGCFNKDEIKALFDYGACGDESETTSDAAKEYIYPGDPRFIAKERIRGYWVTVPSLLKLGQYDKDVPYTITINLLRNIYMYRSTSDGLERPPYRLYYTLYANDDHGYHYERKITITIEPDHAKEAYLFKPTRVAFDEQKEPAPFEQWVIEKIMENVSFAVTGDTRRLRNVIGRAEYRDRIHYTDRRFNILVMKDVQQGRMLPTLTTVQCYEVSRGGKTQKPLLNEMMQVDVPLYLPADELADKLVYLMEWDMNAAWFQKIVYHLARWYLTMPTVGQMPNRVPYRSSADKDDATSGNAEPGQTETKARSRKALGRYPTSQEFVAIWWAHLTQAPNESGTIGMPDADDIYRHSTLLDETKQMKYAVLAESGLFSKDQIKRLFDYGACGDEEEPASAAAAESGSSSVSPESEGRLLKPEKPKSETVEDSRTFQDRMTAEALISPDEFEERLTRIYELDKEHVCKGSVRYQGKDYQYTMTATDLYRYTWHFGPAYFRAGDIFVLNAAVLPKPREALGELLALYPKVIKLYETRSDTGNGGWLPYTYRDDVTGSPYYLPHTIGLLIAMQGNQDAINGHTFIDAFSRNGLMANAAYLLGASDAVIIENDEQQISTDLLKFRIRSKELPEHTDLIRANLAINGNSDTWRSRIYYATVREVPERNFNNAVLAFSEYDFGFGYQEKSQTELAELRRNAPHSYSRWGWNPDTPEGKAVMLSERESLLRDICEAFTGLRRIIASGGTETRQLEDYGVTQKLITEAESLGLKLHSRFEITQHTGSFDDLMMTTHRYALVMPTLTFNKPNTADFNSTTRQSINEACALVKEIFARVTAPINFPLIAQVINEHNGAEVIAGDKIKDGKIGFIFSEMATFGDDKDEADDRQGLYAVLLELANRGIKAAVLSSRDPEKRANQEALIKELNHKIDIDKPERRIRYGTSVEEISGQFADLTIGRPARFYYLKTNSEDPIPGVIDSINIIVREIIDILGKVCGIFEPAKIEQLHRAARECAEAM
ncbi:MAG: HEAT repeat domain-containing protein [Candidatus Omnitrophota bacterium]